MRLGLKLTTRGGSKQSRTCSGRVRSSGLTSISLVRYLRRLRLTVLRSPATISLRPQLHPVVYQAYFAGKLQMAGELQLDVNDDARALWWPTIAQPGPANPYEKPAERARTRTGNAHATIAHRNAFVEALLEEIALDLQQDAEDVVRVGVPRIRLDRRAVRLLRAVHVPPLDL